MTKWVLITWGQATAQSAHNPACFLPSSVQIWYEYLNLSRPKRKPARKAFSTIQFWWNCLYCSFNANLSSHCLDLIVTSSWASNMVSSMEQAFLALVLPVSVYIKEADWKLVMESNEILRLEMDERDFRVEVPVMQLSYEVTSVYRFRRMSPSDDRFLPATLLSANSFLPGSCTKGFLFTTNVTCYTLIKSIPIFISSLLYVFILLILFLACSHWNSIYLLNE